MAGVKIYDATLREGVAMEGVSLHLEDKLKIMKRLDDFGVHYIEGGFPYSNPKELEFFEHARDIELKTSRLVAFGSTRRALIKITKDEGLEALLQAGTSAVCIVGKSWDFHVESALKTSLDENLFMISDSIEYLKKHDLEVIYDAEHFFDAFKNNPKYALKTIGVAGDAGADWVVLCDTNGGSLPHEVASITGEVKERTSLSLGIHAHNDSECAVANTLVAVRKGVTQVQGTINGYGERCGNANLCSVIPDLVLKMDIDCIDRESLTELTELSYFVSEVVNIVPDAHQPFVGMSAFAHKGGLHASAVSKEPETYEHIRPEMVGSISRILVSEIAGKRTIWLKAKELGMDVSKKSPKLSEILKKVKELEHVGYHFEAADGSFEILLRKELKKSKIFFRLESFRVIMEKREDGKVVTEATIKIHVGDERIIATAEGNGPVNALDKALRLAIEKSYPALKDIELTDYKVRVLDEKKGTGAITRVLIETSDGEKSWGTIGVSENIIEASWEALQDSIEYGLLHKRPGHEPGAE